MSALVGYGSSDEEDDIQPEKPAKIARIEKAVEHPTVKEPQNVPVPQASHIPDIIEPKARTDDTPTTAINGPTHGPSRLESAQPSGTQTPISAPQSPYTTERQRIQELTMPTVPNFDIPDSPPPPATNSEEAASLAATTKKFERFLELKRQGVHFNARLQQSTALRNPSLLPKLMDFAGISKEDSYASSLSEEVGVPVRWAEECYVENLMRENERREKKRKEKRERVDFVAADASKSANSSARGTPKSVASDGDRGRKTKFDRR